MKIKIKNISGTNQRLLFRPNSPNANVNIIDPTHNPTLGFEESGSFYFCLAPTNNIISCDGATTEAWFTNGSGAFHITVNGQFYENPDNWWVNYMINQIPELDVIIGYGGEGGFIIFNKSSDFLRIKLEPVGGDVWGIYEENNNPTIDISDDGVIQFCLAPIDTNNSRYTLTVDDKGIFPSDNIYSGTISPPNPSLYLTFRIQWFSDMNMNEGTRNRRVLYVDNDYMQFSLDGSTWSVNLNLLQSSLLPNHMDESGFYELAIFPITGLNDPSSEIISDEIYYPYSPIEEPEFAGETDFAFYSSSNKYLGRFRTLEFQLIGHRLEVDGPIPWRLIGSFNFYSLNLSGYVSDLIAAYNNGMGTFTLSEDSFGVSELELTENNFRSIFQLSVQDGINYFHYRGTRGGVFSAGGQGLQDSFSITPQTPLKPWNN